MSRGGGHVRPRTTCSYGLLLSQTHLLGSFYVLLRTTTHEHQKPRGPGPRGPGLFSCFFRREAPKIFMVILRVFQHVFLARRADFFGGVFPPCLTGPQIWTEIPPVPWPTCARPTCSYRLLHFWAANDVAWDHVAWRIAKKT